jgi:nucleotide-binding universal stress UspA family protein
MPRSSILVPLDISDVTDAVLREARRLAKTCNAEVRLVHVGCDSHKTCGMEFELADYVDRVKAQCETRRARLNHYAKVIGHEGYPVQVSFPEGDAPKAILEVASVLNPAAIVIGTHAHGALHQALRGGVRRTLLEKGVWPFLVVPAGRKQGGRNNQSARAAWMARRAL